MSQGCIRRKDLLSKALMLQMEHQLKPRWFSLAGAGEIVCDLVDQNTKKYMHQGRGRNHEDSFHAAYEEWLSAQTEQQKVQLENESLRERLRDLEQQVDKSSATEDPAAASEDSTPDEQPPPRRRRVKKKSTPVESSDF
tara:strand:+ start:809 stop:1225 length:417 start_codon:yes stop_codon:yes gene_type:complete